MNRETLDRWCERGILGLVLGILVFSPLAFGAARLQEFLGVQLLTVLVLLLWLVRIWLGDKPKFLFPPLSWVVVAFVGYAIGRYLTCDVEYIGRQELLRILVYAAMYFVVLNNLHRQESTQIIAFTLFGLALLLSFYAVFQFATKSDLVWNVHSTYVGRGSGTYICPNHLAGFLELLIPLATAYAIAGRGKALTKILISYTALAMLAGVAVTASRGSWVAVALALIGLALLLMTHRSFRWPAIALLAILIAGGSLAANKTIYFKLRMSRAISAAGSLDLDMRLGMWDSAIRMWRDHVWFGVGPGHYDVLFREYRPATVQPQADRTHNDYLNTLADFGVIGGALVALAMGLLAHGVIKVWKHVQRDGGVFSTNHSDKFAFVIGSTLGLFALALHSFVDFNFHIPANAIIAVTLIALLTSHWRFATERFWFSVRLPGKAIATTGLLLALGYLGVQTIQLGRECLWLNRATASENFTLNQAQLLEHGYAIEPKNGDTAYAIGEIYRVLSFEGKADFESLAQQALTWYQRAITNNPHGSDYYLRVGMVLDFLDRHDEAESLFLKADDLDPNGYFTSAQIGQHYIDSGNYAAARPWLERSLLLEWKKNPLAEAKLKLVNERLLEAAQDPLLQKMREQLRRQVD